MTEGFGFALWELDVRDGGYEVFKHMMYVCDHTCHRLHAFGLSVETVRSASFAFLRSIKGARGRFWLMLVPNR
jgi:hypothetical protein